MFLKLSLVFVLSFFEIKSSSVIESKADTLNKVLVEISFGELIDKMTILQIKSERVRDRAKLSNVKRELNSLNTTYRNLKISETLHTNLREHYLELKKVNEALWDIENDIRLKEKNKDFGDEFIQLARNVYITNDERAKLKRKLNDIYGSTIVEEKDYAQYRKALKK